MKKTLLALPLLLLFGCATTIPPKYTVLDPIDQPLRTLDASSLTLRMRQDLRAYSTPLCFNADGTVTPINDLTYYAPLEVALEYALADVTTFAANPTPPLRITVKAYCVDNRTNTPIATVTLATKDKTLTRTAPLPVDYTIPQLRTTLAKLLLDAYTAL